MGVSSHAGQLRKRRHERTRPQRGRSSRRGAWRQEGGTCEKLFATLCPLTPESSGQDRTCRMRIHDREWLAGVPYPEALQKLQENLQSRVAEDKGTPWGQEVKRQKRRFTGRPGGKALKKRNSSPRECRGGGARIGAGAESFLQCWVSPVRMEIGWRSSGDEEMWRGSLGKEGDGGCVGIGGVECGGVEKEQRDVGRLGSWLDSCPDLVPGAFLCDECDSAPSPSQDLPPGNVASECHAASVSAKSTPFQTVAVAPQQTSQRKPIVFLWDLDETLILATSLTTGQYAQYNRDLDEKKIAELGANWLRASTYISEKHLYSKQIRNEDRATVSDLHEHDDGMPLYNYDFGCDLTPNGFSDEDGLRKLAYRYRKITEFYKLGLERSNVTKYVPFWQDLWKKTDSYCKSWLSSVQNLLEATLASDQDVVHVLVTAGCLIPSLTKLMLFQMDKYFDVHNVFSSNPFPDGKFDVFRAVRARFGPDATYCAIGDGPYEELAAAENGWPFVRISLSPDSLPTVGTSGGLDSLGRFGSTPMTLSRDDLLAAAKAVVPFRARADVPLKFKESSRKALRAR